ncbi:uncharacterized protein [Anoplolepis gracilipes]|uniref:uncharacterized protein n=1 Tax=Anoplolepis gracilipes TaxID=354296 RepID=UPI003B9F4B38
MESIAEPTPAKRRCFKKNDKIKSIERVRRQFQLPQQFPSTLKEAIDQGIAKPVEEPLLSTIPENAKMLPNIKRQIPHKLHKLRILSPNGKDLGEFNLKLKADNPSKGKTIMISKSNTFKSVKKPVTVTLSPVLSKNVTWMFKQNIKENNSIDINSCSKNDFVTNKVSQQFTTLPINIIRKNHTEIRNNEAQAYNSDTNETGEVEIAVSTSETHPKQFYQTTDSNSKKHIICNGINNVNRRIRILKSTIKKDNEITSVTKVPLHKEVTQSSFPIINLQDVVNSVDSNNVHKAEEYSQSTTLTSEYNTAVSSGDDEKNVSVHCDKVLCDTKCENTQNEQKVLKKGSENDYSTIVIDNPLPMECISESQQTTNTTDTTIQLDVQNKDSSKDTNQSNLLDDQWDIIKKAMDSVTDNELRALALKALADCGIGIERHVSKPLPEDLKAVHDTQVQTMVFGLLEPKSFIFINKDLDSIQRINQISVHDIPSQNQLTNNLHFNDSLLKTPLPMEQENDFDIDNFLKQILEENSDAVKMKDTLSITKMRCKNIIEHLEKDFGSVKRYDKNGLLNIHNAVVSNNIHLVQRQLMVLKHCKESVDILTEDGVTSLELAIKYDARSEIVELLLKAGAQPVTSRYIHESALIIASKQSSPLLSMLIDHVSDSKLLDQIDSEGFATLHYCSMRDNLQGVKALLSAGATKDLKDMRSGRTPLFHALDNGHTAVAQTLLKAGAVANITNYAGQAPVAILSEKFAFQNYRKETT